MKDTKYIDLTPRGMMTPEGNKRVNEALAAREEAARCFASLAFTFIEQNRIALMKMVAKEKIDNPAILLNWKQLIGEHEEYRRRSEAFVRAVAGEPPQN